MDLFTSHLVRSSPTPASHDRQRSARSGPVTAQKKSAAFLPNSGDWLCNSLGGE